MFATEPFFYGKVSENPNVHTVKPKKIEGLTS